MKKIFTPLSFAILSLIAPGCASIVSKTSYPLVVTTNPPGASVLVLDRQGTEIYRGNSPATTKLKSGAGFFKGATYTIKIEKDGFDMRTVQVTSRINGWYFGNLVIGGLIGFLIVDPATGAMYKLDNTVINENLAESTASRKEPSLNIYLKENIPANWEGHLVCIN